MSAHHLTTYQQFHLAPVFEHHKGRFYPAMLRASQAHVVMLTEQGLLSPERGAQLQRGLVELTDHPRELVYDGTVEDVYFTLEKQLADACDIPTSELDLQMARSRNDLDQGIFRMLLRVDLLGVVDRMLETGTTALERAEKYADVVITGYTHRRPAQPTTIGHVLAGYAEALTAELEQYTQLLDQVNLSPLGACAFAGTDLDISSPRLAELLGFDGVLVNSYEAVAGADHLVRVATTNAQALATGARLARTLMNWLSDGWVVTPPDFTQGSSIMPQKRNPVVLEHLVSMAGAAAADAASVLNNVGAAWWEDSNNATTDVQARLWDSDDRTERFFALLGGFLAELEPHEPPTDAEIVRSGATTTAAADALTRHGVPFRAAHTLAGRLFRADDPAGWTEDAVRAAADELGLDELAPDAVTDLMTAARRPSTVLDRTQPDGPGTEAVRVQVCVLRQRLAGVRERVDALGERLTAAEELLDREVAEQLAR
ncbi:argininosuccinate lyase [Georgenia subflava]|uniref:argininosuccinate lyase n=1 Tax=Georgenia subflava TaxID=1622177 RepID=A0A6N7EF20_9MICO|nr:lyase family protein [Georgenia subflava]MPV35548.1 argininosuccinate lyase [Georgenia subflava]